MLIYFSYILLPKLNHNQKPTKNHYINIVSYPASFISSSIINTLTANYEYSLSNRENLPLPVQMQFTEKPKTFLKLLTPKHVLT